jgi:YD repeat-containing protein
VKVTDALGDVTRYAYDETGMRTSQEDANQHTTTFT